MCCCKCSSSSMNTSVGGLVYRRYCCCCCFAALLFYCLMFPLLVFSIRLQPLLFVTLLHAVFCHFSFCLSFCSSFICARLGSFSPFLFPSLSFFLHSIVHSIPLCLIWFLVCLNNDWQRRWTTFAFRPSIQILIQLRSISTHAMHTRCLCCQCDIARASYFLSNHPIYTVVYIFWAIAVSVGFGLFFLLLFVCFFSFFIVPNILIESLQYIYTSLPIEHTLCSIQNCCWNTNNITKISFRILLNKLLYFFRMGFSLLLLLYFFFALSVSLGSFSSRVCACVSFALYPVYSLSFSLDLCIYIFVQFVVD